MADEENKPCCEQLQSEVDALREQRDDARGERDRYIQRCRLLEWRLKLVREALTLR